jgi:maltooligosyltrehalose trehalohydrolase
VSDCPVTHRSDLSELSVWAPTAERLDLVTGGVRRPMSPDEGGWWRLRADDLTHGSDYAFAVDGGDPTPDPRSRWQPHGVHASSRLYDHGAFAWQDAAWRGVPLAGAVLYELHIGTFTAEGTFDAAIERLDHLVELGVDAVEVLPVASFDGTAGWGYDGVALWAVHEPYGGPDGFKRFVDACHRRGLGVVLDVVYNHLGPSGNYLSRFGPYFTELHHTPWGAAVNLDDAGSDEVRRWILDNALSWLRDYHVDGLRLDAVHALVDERAVHLLQEMSAEVDALAASVGRPLFLIAESDLNDPKVITPREAGGWGLTAQWSDDFHHALHANLTGETQGYYCDFGDLSALARTLTGGYFHDGCYSTFRGRHHGRPLDRAQVPAYRLVSYLQDHDQVGNRATGDRISATLSPGLLRIGAALYLSAPFTPMLFMGEEWGATTPWQFFTSFADPELGRAVSEGRRGEFAAHGWDSEDVPDPQDPATFERSRLDWAEVDKPEHADLLEWYRSLIALRKATPELTDPRLDRVEVDHDDDARWLVVRRKGVSVVCNLAAVEQPVPVGSPVDAVLLASAVATADGDSVTMPPESVAVVRTGA